MENNNFALTYTEKYLQCRKSKEIIHPQDLQNNSYYKEFYDRTGKHLSEFSRFIHEDKDSETDEQSDAKPKRSKYMLNLIELEKQRVAMLKPIRYYGCIKGLERKNYQDKLWSKINEVKSKPVLCEFKSPVDPLHRAELEEMIKGDTLLRHEIESIVSDKAEKCHCDISKIKYFQIQPERSELSGLNEHKELTQRYLVCINSSLNLNPWSKINKFTSFDCLSYLSKEAFTDHLFYNSKIDLIQQYQNMKICSTKNCVELERLQDIDIQKDPSYSCSSIRIHKSIMPDECDRRLILEKVRLTPIKASAKIHSNNFKKGIEEQSCKFALERYLK